METVHPTVAKLARDLTKQPPRPPQESINGIVQLGRTIDKCRALLTGKIGEYHYDCPVDRMLFAFNGISGEQLKEVVAQGKTDKEIAEWFISAGTPRTGAEIIKFSKDFIAYSPYNDPQKRDWFIGVCTPLGLDPAKATQFDFLNADDKATFAK